MHAHVHHNSRPKHVRINAAGAFTTAAKLHRTTHRKPMIQPSRKAEIKYQMQNAQSGDVKERARQADECLDVAGVDEKTTRVRPGARQGEATGRNLKTGGGEPKA